MPGHYQNRINDRINGIIDKINENIVASLAREILLFKLYDKFYAYTATIKKVWNHIIVFEHL